MVNIEHVVCVRVCAKNETLSHTCVSLQSYGDTICNLIYSHFAHVGKWSEIEREGELLQYFSIETANDKRILSNYFRVAVILSKFTKKDVLWENLNNIRISVLLMRLRFDWNIFLMFAMRSLQRTRTVATSVDHEEPNGERFTNTCFTSPCI